MVAAAQEGPSRAVRGPPARMLGRARNRTQNRAATMGEQLYRWMQRFARQQARTAVEELFGSTIVTTVFKASLETVRTADLSFLVLKADDDRKLQQQLRRILVSNGASAFTSSVARTVGAKRAVIPDQRMAEFMRTKEIRLQQIMSASRRDVRESVRQIILTALAESPRPSTSEIARRISQTFHGSVGGRPAEQRLVDGVLVPVEVSAPLIDSRVLPTTRVRLTGGGNLYAFSPERASLIARTEMAQAENEGIVEGYVQTGVEGLRWLAYRDGRSGDREHDEMHRETTRIGVPFVLPDRTRMLYPGDPTAPIKHLANCRCTVAPVLFMD